MNHAAHVWEAVQSGRAAARSEVAASWRRSALHHGLDPTDGPQAERLAADRLSEARARCDTLIAAANPQLDQLARLLLRSGRCILLTTADGLVLEGRIGDGDVAFFEEHRLVPGEDWSEAAEGTNGIGTCLAEGRRLTVFREEHFRAANIGMTCTDVPIHGARGELVGALDVSTARADDDRAMAALVMQLLFDAARGIEHRLFRDAHRDCRILTLGDTGPHGDALLAVDQDDLVVGASFAARRRAGLAEVSADTPVLLGDVLGQCDEAPCQMAAERRMLRQALARSRGNAAAAARALGIGRATLYRRMHRAGLMTDNLAPV